MVKENFSEISVPEYVRFISDWEGYSIPDGHVILDKGVTGCGYTEFCIRNNTAVILVSPRKVLLENKAAQHASDPGVLYLKNSIYEEAVDYDKPEGLDPNLRRGVLYFEPTEEELAELEAQRISNYEKVLIDFGNRIESHLTLCYQGGYIPKFLVTYDSFKYVQERMGDRLMGFHVVVDEFQSIFLDSHFKANVELDLVEFLQGCPNVLYLSATPMIESYLDEMPEFCDLQYQVLRWSPEQVDKVKVSHRSVKSIVAETSEIIENYRNGKYPFKTLPDGSVRFSTELVIFCNSVSLICQIIKKNKLTDFEANIICSPANRNVKKLKRLKHQIGTVPLKGQPHKMFTFCTRTTYLGADFYSTCASTLVLSDANIESLALDITLDLPQIIGRQRLKENVFKNEVTVLYKILRGDKAITEENFIKNLGLKRKRTNDLVKVWDNTEDSLRDSLREHYRDSISAFNFSKDFVGISKKTSEAVYNTLVDIADRRAWEVTQKIHTGTLSVAKSFESMSGQLEVTTESCRKLEELELDMFVEEFRKDNNFERKMKLYCEFYDNYSEDKEILDHLRNHLSAKESKYESYYLYFGSSKIRALGYKEKPLKSGIYDKMQENRLAEMIWARFQDGQRYTVKEIKATLGDIYSDLNLSTTPKANCIESFFKVVPCDITSKEGHSRGYRILGRKKLPPTFI